MTITMTRFIVDGTLYEVRRTGPASWDVFTTFGDAEYKESGELARFATAEEAAEWARVAHQAILDGIGE